MSVTLTSPAFDNTFAQLPSHFYARQAAAPVPKPRLIEINRELARQLQIDEAWLSSEAGLGMLSGNQMPPGSAPLAAVYAGHQFGHFNPQLGDGRALLLGELLDRDGQRFDLQLKGSGRTPYSRGGDGKSPLGPVLREYLVSEAMHALGVPTSRALAAVTTGEQVYRDRVLPGAILTRVARSHLRIGTLEYFAARNQQDAVKQLLDYTLARHYPDMSGADNPALALLEGVMQRQAELVAQWLSLGFIHGVMNTDNMLLSGETIDYGPCAFMEAYHPARVFSSIDREGRYAFANQPPIAHWNLAQLAQSLLPQISEDMEQAVQLAREALATFPERFSRAYRQRMAAKLGLSADDEATDTLYSEFLDLLAQHELDFTGAFLQLNELAAPSTTTPSDIVTLPEAFEPWLARWRERGHRQVQGQGQTSTQNSEQTPEQRLARMHRANPAFIPRNHQVEAVISAATDQDDFAPFHRLLEVVRQPFGYRAADRVYALPATEQQRVFRTFCGT